VEGGKGFAGIFPAMQCSQIRSGFLSESKIRPVTNPFFLYHLLYIRMIVMHKLLAPEGYIIG